MSLTRIKKLEKIVHLNTLMNRTNDFYELLNVILKETEKMFNVFGTSILLEDQSTRMLYFYLATGEKKDVLKSIKMKKGEGICGYVYETGTFLVENKPETSKFFANRVDKESHFVTKNILAVPLKIKEKTIGVIELVNKKKGYFTKWDLEFLNIIASQVSITLERARFVEEKIKSERLASMGETVAGLAHYIKNILNGLSGGAYIINKNIEQVDSTKVKTGWNMVKKNIDKISELTKDMLQYTKDRIPEYEKVDINSLIEDIIELVTQRAEKTSVEIEKNFQTDLEKIEIESKGIHRCILNLVSNAFDAVEGKKDGKISFLTKKENKSVRIEIKDNGCGIEEESLKKLFTKFFSTKGSKGTGLGLAVTKKIITEHKGSIIPISEVNKGTTFIIKLPIKRDPNI